MGSSSTKVGGVLLAIVLLIAVTPAVDAATPPGIPEVATSVLLDRAANPPSVPTRAIEAGSQGIEIAIDHALVKEIYPERAMDGARIMNIDTVAMREDLNVAAVEYFQGSSSQVRLTVSGDPLVYETVSVMGSSDGPFVAWSGTVEFEDGIHNASATIYAGSTIIELEHIPKQPSVTNPVTVEMLQPLKNQLPAAVASGVQASLAVRSTDFRQELPLAEPLTSSSPAASALTGDGIATYQQTGTVIDVMIAYTSRALVHATENTLAANAINDLNEVNTAIINSGVILDVKVRLVQLREIDFTATNDAGVILELLELGWFGLGVVEDERYESGADVVLFIDDNALSQCGQTKSRFPVGHTWENVSLYEKQSYIVMPYRALIQEGCTMNYTVAHEFGHVFGISHDGTGGNWASYSQAHKVDTPNISFTTVTGFKHDCCPRILRYSNPGLTYGGEPTGLVNLHDGARTIDDTAPYIKDFWPTNNDWVGVESRYAANWHVYTVAADGRVLIHNPFGYDPPYFGDAGDGSVANFIVGMASDPSDLNGYWFTDSAGCMTFHEAPQLDAPGLGIHDTCTLSLNDPIVGIEEYKSSGGQLGYWLVASDGGIFAFGAAGFYGSMGGLYLVSPMVGMARVPGGTGYWTVAADGGIFSFGDAIFHGSLGGVSLNSAIVGMDSAGPGGYWLFEADGDVHAFGNAAANEGDNPYPIVGGSARGTTGYWLVEPDGDLISCFYERGCRDASIE